MLAIDRAERCATGANRPEQQVTVAHDRLTETTHPAIPSRPGPEGTTTGANP